MHWPREWACNQSLGMDPDRRPLACSSKWLRMHVRSICDGIVAECEASLSENVSRAPRHLHDEDELDETSAGKVKSQKDLF